MSMEITERMKMIFEESRKKAIAPPVTSFTYDLHYSANELYASLPRWERQARSMAYAIENQDVFIEPYDKIIGRVYYRGEKQPEKYADCFDFNTQPMLNAQKNDPMYDELCRNQLATYGAPGHVAWNWNMILRQGTDGIRQRCITCINRHKGDVETEHFCNGILIVLDGLEAWNEKHVQKLVEMGKTEEAEMCRQVPKHPARTFREAVQSFFIQFITVMKEEPNGGNSPGRLDYYLWPFLENDLKNGTCTLEGAEELIDELFVRIDERLFYNDGWVESVVLGGSHPSGTSAVNPLSYIMIRSYMKYDITHPHIYVRIPKNAPEDFIDLASDYVINGRNRAQLLCDEAVIRALVKNGVSENDAVDYFCGGCMEVGVQGRTSDFLFTGYQNVAKLLELCMTGGYCLKNKKQLQYFKTKTLAECKDFEEFYSVFLNEAERVLVENLKYQDKLSEYVEQMRPAYLLSSMIDDCLTKGRNMHGGGARYHDYGSSLVGIPNAADTLIAIKKAVFDEKICTASELIGALEADFAGYEVLRTKLQALPKYGQENSEADGMASRISTDMNRICSSYVNRFGGNGKLVLLTFIWAPTAGAILGASADGRKAGVAIAHSITPQSSSMTKGITAAINSCTSLPFELFSGGASTMWDLDPAIATHEIVKSLFTTFFEQGGQIFQGNVTDVEELKKAQLDPGHYGHVVVRVGGYSARFVNLGKALQDDIITRKRHNG